MSEVLIVQNPAVMPAEYLAVAKPIAARWEAAVVRVAAAESEPNRFALPADPNSPEQILQSRFNSLARTKRIRASQRALELNARPKHQKRLGKFVNIGELSPTASVDSLADVVEPPSKEGLLAAADLSFRRLGSPGESTRPALGGLRSLHIDLIRVACIDETNGFLGSEAGDDEIALTGLALDGTTNIGTIEPLTVGNFSDGDVKTLEPARTLFTFDLSSAEFPKAYFVTLILAEEDQGNLSETIKNIVKKLAEQAIDKITALIGANIGSLAGPLGAIIGAIVGWLVGKVIAKIISIWEDDLFDPVTLQAIIPDSAARLAESSKVFHFRGPGEYAVRYQWKLEADPPPVVKAVS